MAVEQELCFASAKRLLALLRSRQVSSLELTSTFVERVEALNPRFNAVVSLVEARALAEAAESDRRLANGRDIRPLEGLPITIKDSIMTAGVRSTDGMKIFEHYVAEHDAPTVARLREAGAVMIGKTNLPELAMDYDCDNPLFGPTRNPWNIERVPGGSSGGEATALAAGLSPLGLGSDLGGSVRVPAHFCGVMALKPSWGTIPCVGHMPPGPAQPPPIAHMATIGPMARTVDDLIIAYNLLRGPHPDSPYTVPSAVAEPAKVQLKQLRCAVFSDGGGAPISGEIRNAVERAGRALQRLGLAVDAATPPLEHAHAIWLSYLMADGQQLMREALGENLKLSRDRLIRNMFGPLEVRSAADFFKISMQRDVFRVQLANFMERYPIIIGAPFCCTAFPHGAEEVAIEGKTVNLFDANWPAVWVNCAGLPAAVVPAGRDREGLPIGVQIVGRAFDEATVLAVAGVLEQELGGYQKPPL